MSAGFTETRQVRPGATRRSIRRNADSILATLFACAVTVAAAYAFYKYVNESTYFLVKTIKVDGTERLDANDVVGASGITNEDNILFLQASEIRARVGALPYVKKCRVTRIYPDMVSITVEERVPVATLMVRNQCFEIDGEGVVLRKLEDGAPYPGPLITQIPGVASVGPGARIEQPSLREAMDVWDAFTKTNLAQTLTVSEIAAPSASDVRMYCDELPCEIRWGRGDAVQQAANLQTVWEYRGGELNCREYVDLRFDRDVACL
ncbi:MAG: FtsQ-type POTRA domain-containing protein [Candidatus Hydrogenedentes bacterium]|nr:FtsQ-type POTRA domain-containing protein [Candidatus Hydrogenedentota bacterium]